MKKLAYFNRVFVMLLLLAIASFSINAESIDRRVQTNRYTYIHTAPTALQKDLLSVVVDIQFPQSIKNVGQAISLLLNNSGYRLEDKDSNNISQYYLYTLPLPEVQRTLGPIELREALRLLGGNGFETNVDPVKRVISYRLIDNYINNLTSEELLLAKKLWLGKSSKQHQTLSKSKWYQYGPVRKNDTLLTITYSIMPRNVSVEQFMMAVFDKSRDAFLKNNINYLMEGKYLNIPDDDDLKNTDYESSKRRVWRHHDKWMQDKVKF